MNVSRRKKEVNVSFAYRLAFFIPEPTVVIECGLGEASMGMTAGSGIEGAGDGERREEKEDRRLWLTTLGGFIGNEVDVGVPGADGTGEPIDVAESRTESWARCPKSGGAGLLDEMRRGGRSALTWLASLGALSSVPSVYCPSLVLSE